MALLPSRTSKHVTFRITRTPFFLRPELDTTLVKTGSLNGKEAWGDMLDR